MNKKGFLNIIIAVIVATAIAGGAYFFFSKGGSETIDKNTGLTQELLGIAKIKEYISDSSGVIDQNFLPFKSSSTQLNLGLVTIPADWDKYKSSYFMNGAAVPQDYNGNGNFSILNYSNNRQYAIQAGTNEHGGANLWDLKGEYVYQLCSHCGIDDSYWLDDHRFILFGVIVPGYAEDNKYHKYMELYDLDKKTISRYTSAGVTDSELVFSINGNFKISDDKKTVYYGQDKEWQVLLNASEAKNPYGTEYREQADEFMKVVKTPDKNKVIISVCAACTADTGASWQFIYDITAKSQKHIAGNGVIDFSPDKRLVRTSDFSDGAGFVVYENIVNLESGESLGQIRTSLAQGELGKKIADFIKARGIKLQEDFVLYSTALGFTEDSKRIRVFTPNDAYYKYQWKFTTDFNGEDLRLESQSDPISISVKYIAPIFKSFKPYSEGYREGGDWTNEYNSVINLRLIDQAQNIYRSVSLSGPWELISTIKLSEWSSETSRFGYQFKDILLPARASKVFYKTRPINAFGEEGIDSEILEVTIPESDIMTATAFICNKNLKVAQRLSFLPIRVPVSNSPQVASEVINSLMKFEIKNVPTWYNWINIFSSLPQGEVKLDSITIQNGIALVKFSAPFDFNQKEELTQECIKGQVKNTLDQFASINKIELHWNNNKVFESPTLAGNTFLRFQYVK